MTADIRPLALAVIRRGDDILVFEGHDVIKGETFYRPLGGGIEFGEWAAEALRREFREELAAELTDVEQIGVVENIFLHEGGPGHEIVFLFSAEFADPSWLAREDLGTIIDEPETRVLWYPIAEFLAGKATLYPDGLAELLATGS
ncbi:NUDIX domain-containing protein [Amycolatopsis xylanica]|uniref:NUDIX domain-containing protein n=1 Tax=Amycolatopsis xylanica TaxID=589385 RepID=A0A1H3QA08_9PSEU|nr:NUDIX domain-containing protein [Amycolatopsis xylanica]SDZ10382.1 NUDIX domain-containing protein [Amycolatopsis xylanica]